jgi:hypothetical protein
MSSQRKSSRSKSAIHHLMRMADVWTVWIARQVVEPRTRVPAVTRARVIDRRGRGAVDMRKRGSQIVDPDLFR